MSISEYLTVFGIMITLFGIVLGGWIDMRIKSAQQELRIDHLENTNDDYKKTVEKIFEELKDIRETLHNKADKSH